jgi:hypothetical protein
VYKELSVWPYRPVRPLIISRYLVGFLEHGLGPTARFTYARNIEKQIHNHAQCAVGDADTGIRGDAVVARIEYFTYRGS